MPTRVESLLRLEVPLIVQLARCQMSLEEVVGWTPGSILELDRNAGDDLDILIKNQVIGSGSALKVGENFGVRVTYLGDRRDRLDAVADDSQ